MTKKLSSLLVSVLMFLPVRNYVQMNRINLLGHFILDELMVTCEDRNTDWPANIQHGSALLPADIHQRGFTSVCKLLQCELKVII